MDPQQQDYHYQNMIEILVHNLSLTLFQIEIKNRIYVYVIFPEDYLSSIYFSYPYSSNLVSSYNTPWLCSMEPGDPDLMIPIYLKKSEECRPQNLQTIE